MPARLALVAAAVLAGLTIPASAASAWSPTPAKITYMNHTGGDYEVTTMNTDGSGVKQLTANTVSDMDPVFSPDGTEIAWAHQVSPNAAELYVMPANGPTPTNPAQQITVDPSGSIRTPSWSLDGSTIYFARAHYDASGTPTTDDIDAVHRVGGMWGEETTVMHDETAFQYEPVISPDGTKLAFDRDPDGPGGSIQSQIWVANIDGTNPHRVSSPSGTAQEYESTWSPDGKQIAFSNGYINTVS